MKVTVTGSLGNVGRILIEKLAASGHTVKVISSNPQKVKDIENLQAIPLIGSLENAEFVSQSFKGADAVYTMVPPNFSVRDYHAFADKIHLNYVQAIEQNHVKYAVNLSSIGVAAAGIEPLKRYYNLEERLNAIRGLNIVHLRPAMFYTNFYGSLEMVKHQGVIGHNLAETVDLLMTHPSDIAEAAFSYLNQPSYSGSQIKYMISDVKNGSEIAKTISEAINKPLHWIAFPDDVLLEGLVQNGFSPDTAESLIINVGKAIRVGLFDEYKKDKYRITGSRKFEDFAKTLAMALR